ncbi:hypothetical protein [Hymenobacter cellulosivorans]|uniref:WD40 repeat domain-containing protein n=1 Tax=Hymenobacter cellulosivorans TaxID=2932249 RepID=A0ABY4FD90_9BACT|nr:hypothetical protein [Hymenobacter cellulosivorans]UOQ54636.1 hypothetical protein MUN80_07700 [Hymenobacter cellulosivorans]
MTFSSLSTYWVVALLLLSSCSQDQPVATTTSPTPPAPDTASTATVPIAAPAAVLSSADVVKATGHDTLRTTTGQVITVQPADLAAWQRARPDALPALPDSVDAPSLAQTGGRVQRSGLNLTLTAANGRTVVLKNDTTDTEDAIAYLYWGELPSVHQWVVNVWLWEGRYVVLIDQRTGQRTDIWGQPAASPDGRYILASSYDLAAAFDANGLQLLRLGTKGPKVIWQRELHNWGPAEARWRPDGTVVVKQGFGPTEEGTDLPPRYVTLSLPTSFR